MKKIKQVFPSRNYITIDSYGDVEVIFNPVGDGFEGDDKLMFRKGRWAFRVNDFLSGKVMADGSKEGMGRKVYSLNLVYDDEDGEPIVNTTYVDPTSVIPLDGSVVDVVGSEKLAQKDLQIELKNVVNEVFDIVADLQTVLVWRQNDDNENISQNVFDLAESQRDIKTALTSDIYNKIGAVENSVNGVKSTVDNLFDDDSGYAMRSQIKAVLDKQDKLQFLCKNAFVEGTDGDYFVDILQDLNFNYVNRFRSSAVNLENIGGNKRYSAGTVFYFGSTRFISLRTDCVSISVGSEFLLLGDMSEYNNGTVKRLDGVKFAQSDVTKIVS